MLPIWLLQSTSLLPKTRIQQPLTEFPIDLFLGIFIGWVLFGFLRLIMIATLHRPALG